MPARGDPPAGLAPDSLRALHLVIKQKLKIVTKILQKSSPLCFPHQLTGNLAEIHWSKPLKLPNHVPRLFILAQPHKFRMTQNTAAGPFIREDQ